MQSGPQPAQPLEYLQPVNPIGMLAGLIAYGNPNPASPGFAFIRTLPAQLSPWVNPQR